MELHREPGRLVLPVVCVLRGGVADHRWRVAADGDRARCRRVGRGGAGRHPATVPLRHRCRRADSTPPRAAPQIPWAQVGAGRLDRPSVGCCRRRGCCSCPSPVPLGCRPTPRSTVGPRWNCWTWRGSGRARRGGGGADPARRGPFRRRPGLTGAPVRPDFSVSLRGYSADVVDILVGHARTALDSDDPARRALADERPRRWRTACRSACAAMTCARWTRCWTPCTSPPHPVPTAATRERGRAAQLGRQRPSTPPAGSTGRPRWPSCAGPWSRAATGSARLGTGHSFNRDRRHRPATCVSLAGLPPEVDVDPAARTVTVGGRAALRRARRAAARRGPRAGNLASLPHISVAGAVATGTHGSGDAQRHPGDRGRRRWSSSPRTASCSRLDRGRRRRFAGAVVALGALGVVTALTLTSSPPYDVRQDVYDGPARGGWRATSTRCSPPAYSVSLFTDWRARGVDQVWLKRRADGPGSAARRAGSGAPAADGAPAPGARACPPRTAPRSSACPARGTSGCRTSGWTSPRAAATSCSPSTSCRASTPSTALARARRASATGSRPVLQVSELRTVAADDLWLSPAYGRDSRGPALHLGPGRRRGARRWSPRSRSALAPFDARPHWGKVFTTPAGGRRARATRGSPTSRALRRARPGAASSATTCWTSLPPR